MTAVLGSATAMTLASGSQTDVELTLKASRTIRGRVAGMLPSQSYLELNSATASAEIDLTSNDFVLENQAPVRTILCVMRRPQVSSESSDRLGCAIVQGDEPVVIPIGPVGKSTELMQITQMMLFKHSKYPNAAKAYMQFMMEPEQYNPWMKAAIGYVSQPLKAYEANAIWTEDPKHTVYRDAAKLMIDHGNAGPLGAASAAALADYIVLDMVAEAASGSKTPKEAAERAAKRAERYYKI